MSTTRIVAGALLAAAVAVPALPAAASHDDVRRQGSCSGRTDWKLKASPEDGRIEVEGEIDSNRVGQTWRWRLVHNGSLSARGTKTTRAPSGSFEVRRVVVNLRGTDKLVFRATNVASRETCRGVVNF
jgi:hypothetical protein